MSRVLFRISFKTIGESHIMVRNHTRLYSTNASHMEYRDNTNVNDKYVSQNLTNYEDCVKSGICFYGTADESKRSKKLVDESKGILPYDTYIIEEPFCRKNRRKKFAVDIKVWKRGTDDSRGIKYRIHF